MRGIATFLGSVAALVTIVSGVIRMRWYSVKMNPNRGPVGYVGSDNQPFPRWAAVFARIWLISVLSLLTVGGIAFMVYVIIDLS